MQNESGYRQAKSELFEVYAKVSPLGFRVGYHNHDFEFETEIEGKPALDYILEPEMGRSIHPEVDTYWVKKAGLDPLNYIKKFPGRMPVLHLKDMTDDDRMTFAEIGTGSIDFEPILQWGEANGVQWYAVEQDECPASPLDSLQLSLNNLIQMTKQMS